MEGSEAPACGTAVVKPMHESVSEGDDHSAVQRWSGAAAMMWNDREYGDAVGAYAKKHSTPCRAGWFTRPQDRFEEQFWAMLVWGEGGWLLRTCSPVRVIPMVPSVASCVMDAIAICTHAHSPTARPC
jgi:hypothetical protein